MAKSARCPRILTSSYKQLVIGVTYLVLPKLRGAVGLNSFKRIVSLSRFRVLRKGPFVKLLF